MLQRLQFDELGSHRREMLPREVPRFGAGPIRGLDKRDQRPNLINREPEIPAPTDQGQTPDVGFPIASLPPIRTVGTGQQADLFVIANGGGIGARPLRQRADFQSHFVPSQSHLNLKLLEVLRWGQSALQEVGAYAGKDAMKAETPPIACTLGGGDFKARVAWIAELNAKALLGYTRDDLKLELNYAAAARDQVLEFVRGEQACCAFLAFQVRELGGSISVLIQAPETAREGADVVFEPFISKAPGSTSCGCCGGSGS